MNRQPQRQELKPEPSPEEQYRDWIEELKQAIADEPGDRVHFAAEMVAGNIKLVNPSCPLLWKEGVGGREIIEVLGQALERINKDIRRKRFDKWNTPEIYQAYAENVQMSCEDVRDYLAQWAVGGARYAELARLTA